MYRKDYFKESARPLIKNADFFPPTCSAFCPSILFEILAVEMSAFSYLKWNRVVLGLLFSKCQKKNRTKTTTKM